ncbi:hypothetical protein CDAR_610111 [Caerostris darwini]|uniref:Uncharacterized protein n=1 Tax=Caerostris darwini TaxID=1538125 RepID=A0AAV4VZX5_9ARAC|nr:hypothetical protein CDAR_610111 [Caerostris darwini]
MHMLRYVQWDFSQIQRYPEMRYVGAQNYESEFLKQVTDGFFFLYFPKLLSGMNGFEDEEQCKEANTPDRGKQGGKKRSLKRGSRGMGERKCRSKLE